MRRDKLSWKFKYKKSLNKFFLIAPWKNMKGAIRFQKKIFLMNLSPCRVSRTNSGTVDYRPQPRQSLRNVGINSGVRSSAFLSERADSDDIKCVLRWLHEKGLKSALLKINQRKYLTNLTPPESPWNKSVKLSKFQKKINLTNLTSVYMLWIEGTHHRFEIELVVQVSGARATLRMQNINWAFSQKSRHLHDVFVRRTPACYHCRLATIILSLRREFSQTGWLAIHKLLFSGTQIGRILSLITRSGWRKLTIAIS